ncbi:reverse transcriptase domain-containing protein [Pedobacter panaciterrae]|uniref:Reverse transcriptase domain-containing protein n=1 Tax=Pedobacter panaciterrae TaxID=363849 RepID=A0ABU8NH42_9SPHI
MRQTQNAYVDSHSGPLNLNDLANHLSGSVSNAIYLLDQNSYCSTFCLDIDIPKMDIPDSANLREEVKRDKFLPVVRSLMDYITTSYNLSENCLLIEDTGGRGYHIWMFLEQPMPGLKVVGFLNEIRQGAGYPDLEIFPPKGSHGRKGFSKSLVRLPLGVHRKYNNSRSVFLHPGSLERITLSQVLDHLDLVEFVPESAIEEANARLGAIIGEKEIQAIKRGQKLKHEGVIPQNLGEVGELISRCPAINSLAVKAKNERNLKHHERFALAALLKNFQDGEPVLHGILSSCENYDLEKSSMQLATIDPCSISCKKLQSTEYGICKGWCNSTLEEAALSGKYPSPVWFSDLNTASIDLKTDQVTQGTIQEVASLRNLSLAWKKAKQQVVERDVFQDKMNFDLFESDLWNNLVMLRRQLLEGKWRHNNFLLVEIPKDKLNTSLRPFCSVSPREAVVEMAILNVVGPKIDSRFHKRSLGNRLAISPKSDNQIFQDWKIQNGIREFKKSSFSLFEPHNHYLLLDITKFYEFIRHDKLMNLLRQFVEDQVILDLIQQYIEAPFDRVEHEYEGHRRTVGIPQGPALSALLANLYLNELDYWLAENSIDFVRYVDDLAILFENVEMAEGALAEYEQALNQEYGLNLNLDKKEGPHPVTKSEKLHNFLDKIRYDFVRSNVSTADLNREEQEELFETLNKVAGNVDQDIRTLTKSLGFYVRFSQHLRNAELENKVFKIATFLLEEDRPKHSATCIAVSSLIKSCSEPEKTNWQLFKGLLDNRTDEYFKIIVAQEAGKLYEVSQLQNLSEEIIQLLIQLAADGSAPVAAAAAINTLIRIQELRLDEENINKFKAIGVGSGIFLRMRVVAWLDRQELVNETYLARALPETLFEIELMGSLLRFSSGGIFQELIKAIQILPFAILCLPRVVLKAILFQNAAGVQLFEILNDEDKKKSSYYIAEKTVEFIFADQDAPVKIQQMLTFLSGENQTLLYRELFLFASSGRLLAANTSLPNPGNVEEHDPIKYQLETEPCLPGVVLGELVFPFYRYIHFGSNTDGKALFHEQLNDNELMKVGKSVSDYLKAMNALMAHSLTLQSLTSINTQEGFLLMATIVPAEYQSLNDFLSTQTLSPNQIWDLLQKINELVKQCMQILSPISETVLVPVPTLHTVFIHTSGKMIFGLNSLTIGSERRFVGKQNMDYKLQSDRWLVEILGLLLYELDTSKCAVQELVRSGKIAKENLSLLQDSHGLIFWSIINKATQFTPANRYALVDYFLKDVAIWTQIQTAFLANQNILEADKKLVNTLWSIEIKINRIAAREYHASESLLNYGLKMQRRIVDMLADKEVHQAAPFTDSWQLIGYGEHYDRHLATVQATAISKRVDDLVVTYRQNLGIKEDITFTKWLLISSATIELEALRRSMFLLAKDKAVEDELKKLTEFLAMETATGHTFIVKSVSDAPLIRESCAVFKENLPDLENRIKVWLERPATIPSPLWTYDILLVMFIIVSKYYGLEFLSDSGKSCQLKARRKLFNATEVMIILQKLTEIFRCDLGRVTTNSHVFGAPYTVSKMIGLNEVNLHLARNLYRCYDYLQVAINGQLKFSDFAVFIRSRRKQVLLSQPLVIEEIHNPFDTHHGIGCAFSIDVQEVNGKLVPSFASFPIVGHKTLDRKLLPELKKVSAYILLSWRTNYQRRNPYTSMLLDLHILYLVGGVLVFYIALQLLGQPGEKEVVLNGFVYGIIFILFSSYFVVSWKRFMNHKSKISVFIKELN